MAELFEILRVGVVVDREVGLHGAQLVVLEASAHALGARRGSHSAAAAKPHLQILGVQIWLENRNAAKDFYRQAFLIVH